MNTPIQTNTVFQVTFYLRQCTLEANELQNTTVVVANSWYEAIALARVKLVITEQEIGKITVAKVTVNEDTLSFYQTAKGK